MDDQFFTYFMIGFPLFMVSTMLGTFAWVSRNQRRRLREDADLALSLRRAGAPTACCCGRAPHEGSVTSYASTWSSHGGGSHHDAHVHHGTAPSHDADSSWSSSDGGSSSWSSSDSGGSSSSSSSDSGGSSSW